jgi:nitrate reductase gamma subunit
VGSILRMDRDPYTWRAKSSQLLRKKSLMAGSLLFHVGILFLLVGHFIGLLTPQSLYHAFGLTAPVKQQIAMFSGGAFGAVALGGLTILLWRRLTDVRIRNNSSFMDIALLVILYVQLILGLMSINISAQHPDGSSMIALANWAQHIVTFRDGAAEFIIHEHWIFKAHIVLGVTLFLITPFTRLVHVFSAPIWYVFRTGYQIVRKRS